MIELLHEKEVPYSADKMFHLIKDVESYDQFLPWILESKTSNHGDGFFTGTLTIAYKQFKHTYDSRVVYNEEAGTVKSLALNGPFKTLSSNWEIKPTPLGSFIRLHLRVEFDNFLYKTILTPILKSEAENMIDAFEKRAELLA